MNNPAKLWRYLVLDPVRKASPALLLLRILQILHERTNGRCDRPVQRLLSVLRPPTSLSPSRSLGKNDIVAAADNLRQRGWHILPWRLGSEEISAIRAFAFSTPAYTAEVPTGQFEIRADRIPREYPRYQWRISKLIRLSAVQRIATDSAMARIAQEYLGSRPILTSVTLWLDPEYDGKFGAHIYHYDNDGPGFLKFFIYLSDVDIETGAHSYIQGSHPHIKPDEFKRPTFYDRDVLLGHYGSENEIVFSGPAGTILAEDTAGFHRGSDLKRGYRLLMQLQYAIFDIPHDEEFIFGIERVRVGEIDSAIRPIIRKFFT